MSYQVLARKWRPKDFGELVGQQQTAQALINALTNQRLHHAYLFTGTRGVGKTTIARILSKSLNCELGISANPCGECASCVEISQGNFVDLLEIDAASKTKVEDTRELLDNVQYRPTRGRYKVYLIDEVHMLSGHSFNALLKTLEEPPPHVIFLLATTDPQKLPVTVLSRCLQFHLRRMEIDEITGHLSKILQAENFEFEADALAAIAKGADGSMRDALSLLDQAIAFCGDNIQTQTVLDMLGSIDKEYGYQLLDAITSGDAQQLLAVIDKISQFSPDYDELLADWLSLLHQVAVVQASGSSLDERITNIAQSVNRADIQLFYQLTLHARKDLKFAANPRQGFEMAMLRILTFKPQIQPTDNKLTNLANATSGSINQNHSAEKKTLANEVQSKRIDENIVEREVPQTNVSVKNNQISMAAQQLMSTASDNERSQTRRSVHTAAQAQPNTEPHLQDVSLKPASNQNPPSDQKTSNTKLQLVSDSQPIGEQMGAENERDISNFSEQNASQDFVDNKVEEVIPEPVIKKLALTEINESNWYKVVDALKLEGHGLQILLNSIGVNQDGNLRLDYYQRVETLLTAYATQSIFDDLRNYFEDDKLQIVFNPVEDSSETPKERSLRLHEVAVDEAYAKLLSNEQVGYLKAELNAILARESIKFVN